jgi:hypothetical protein
VKIDWDPVPFGIPCNKLSLWLHHPAEETYLIPAKLPPKGEKKMINRKKESMGREVT